MQDVVEASMEKATEQAVKAMVVMKVENRGVCKVAPTGAEMQAVVEAIDLASMVMAAQEARWAVCIAAGACLAAALSKGRVATTSRRR